MKIRITQAGYENFTGDMGHIEFVDGVSVHGVAGTDFARSLGGIVQIEEISPDEPGTEPEGGPL